MSVMPVINCRILMLTYSRYTKNRTIIRIKSLKTKDKLIKLCDSQDITVVSDIDDVDIVFSSGDNCCLGGEETSLAGIGG